MSAVGLAPHAPAPWQYGARHVIATGKIGPSGSMVGTSRRGRRAEVGSVDKADAISESRAEVRDPTT